MVTRFYNGALCDKGVLKENTTLYVDETTGVILDGSKINVNNVDKHIDLQGNVLAPGFLDIQNNGVYGFNFAIMEGSERQFTDDYQKAMTRYMSTGVTGVCPTVISADKTTYQKVLPHLGATRLSSQCDSLGVHCEGPFISLNKKGCHNPKHLIEDATKVTLADVYGNDPKEIKVVTVAPEIPGIFDQIPLMCQKGWIVSVGHTTASYQQASCAVEKGATLITHLYNAMPAPHHRKAGVVGTITLAGDKGSPTPYFGMIADGIHIDKTMVAMAYRAAPGKCILVTDTMHLYGLPDGVYNWDGQVLRKKGAVVLVDGTETLAGSATDLPSCLRNLMEWADLSLAEAVACVTNHPANVLDLEKKKGYLDPGCDADLVVLNRSGYVQKVFKLGNPVTGSKASKL
ncbi:uncharacterized protein KQ657_001629 [Scheffersomyces spartinae]|uniref:N-acetylglucosamine-6-phosphate deacetylase n=1 Tax=Scheffersomyces spartinae TaxID=45513 RepID=A0A9P7V6Z5_9ASCO|nr:uncharacterized protein KQ657_001629 [Scheffersomyces spartinae]KAG7192534.1 hypothetical protein KQ657_001629 [Scheffersomyces spartinae]